MQDKRKRIKDKLKKTIALAVIANILLSLFCLSAFATVNYPNSITLNIGDEIIFNDTIKRPENSFSIYINGFNRYNSTGAIFSSEYTTLYIARTSTSVEVSYMGTNITTFSAYTSNAWVNEYANKIIITQETTISDENTIIWLYNNVKSGLPAFSNIEIALGSAKEFYSTSLNFGTALITFITVNAITTIPIILFVFIALLGCGIALIKRK